jgi:hypothetical protein
MSLKRGSVLGVLVLCLVLVGVADGQAQGNGNGSRGNPRSTSLIEDGGTAIKAQIAALSAELDQALATIAQLPRRSSPSSRCATRDACSARGSTRAS